MKLIKIKRIVTIIGLFIKIMSQNNHTIKAMELGSAFFIETTESGSGSSRSSLSSPDSSPESKASSRFTSPLSTGRTSIIDGKTKASQADQISRNLEQQWHDVLSVLPTDTPEKARKEHEKMFYKDVVRDACRTEDNEFQEACRHGNAKKIQAFLNGCDLTDKTVDPEKLQTVQDMLAYFKTMYHRYNIKYALFNNARKLVTLKTILENDNVINASLLAHDAPGAPLITENDINAALMNITQEYDQDSKPIVHYLMAFTFTPGEKLTRPHYIQAPVWKAADAYLASFTEQDALEQKFQEELKREQEREERLKGQKPGKPTQVKKIAPTTSNSQNLRIFPKDGKSSGKSSFWSRS